MVAMPQWADQPTTAKYVESAWGTGLRMRKGLVKREEVERCIREEAGVQVECCSMDGEGQRSHAGRRELR
nr:unnamed protein product [Digitaria exilis]